MLGDDEDVFDSVTWESPAAPNVPDDAPSSGPGFRQSTATDSGGPNDPKWEGYLFTTVKDPVKELAETKDAYVSYLVSAKVRRAVHHVLVQSHSRVDELAHLFHSEPLCSPTLPRLCLPAGEPGQRFSCMRDSTSSGQAPTRYVLPYLVHVPDMTYSRQNISPETGSVPSSWNDGVQSKD